jgi:hypothetical protein
MKLAYFHKSRILKDPEDSLPRAIIGPLRVWSARELCPRKGWPQVRLHNGAYTCFEDAVANTLDVRVRVKLRSWACRQLFRCPCSLQPVRGCRDVVFVASALVEGELLASRTARFAPQHSLRLRKVVQSLPAAHLYQLAPRLCGLNSCMRNIPVQRIWA